jgi:uncharacterized lipoprotein
MKKMILVGLAIIGVAGCAAMRASQARDAQLEKLTTAHTYKQSCQEVWGATRTMLFAQNYQVKSADAAAGLTLETDWKDEKEGNASRYMFQGTAPAEKECKVMATRAFKTAKGDTSMQRDWKMEWNLVKQVDLTAAQLYEEDANKAGEAARNQK